MGQCLITRKGSNMKFDKKTLEAFGFKNVPEGEWIMKTGNKSIKAKDTNIIPIVEASRIVQEWMKDVPASNGSFSYNRYDRVFPNGHTGMYLWYAIDGLGQNNLIQISATGYNIFLPAFCQMDLSYVQNNFTYGTLTVWFEKIG